MRLPRFRLRTLMICIAFLALLLTVIMQHVQLQRAAIQAELFRAVAELSRAEAEANAQRARQEAEKARAEVDRISKQFKQFQK